MKRSLVVLLGIMAFIGLLSMIFLTSPMEAGPLGVLVFFTTLYVAIFSCFSGLLSVFLKLAVRRKVMRGKDYLYVAVLSFMPIMLLMARTFGATSVWVTSLIIVFVSLVEFLVYKRV